MNTTHIVTSKHHRVPAESGGAMRLDQAMARIQERQGRVTGGKENELLSKMEMGEVTANTDIDG